MGVDLIEMATKVMVCVFFLFLVCAGAAILIVFFLFSSSSRWISPFNLIRL